MIDHTGISLAPSHYPQTLSFYLAALAPLGYVQLHSYGPTVAGLGVKEEGKDGEGHADFWIAAKEDFGSGEGVHFGFRAKDRATVDAFHKAGLAAGGKCNGPPGERAQYGPGYYGAFLIDPVGNNVEAVFHGAE